MFGVQNPQFLLQPWKNLTQFTEELFAALTSKAPVEHQGPVTIRVPEGQTALRIVRGGSEPEVTKLGSPKAQPPADLVTRTVTEFSPRRQSQGRFQPPSFPDLASSARPAASQLTQPPLVTPPLQRQDPVLWQQPPASPPLAPMPQAPEPQGVHAPLVSIEGAVTFSGPEPVRFDAPPQIFDQKRKKYITPKAFEIPDLPGTPAFPISSGTTVFVGKVQSGSGGTYQVVLYQNGPNGDPDPSAVTVTIPMIANAETIDSGTWLYGVFQFTDNDGNDTYSCQPPVWMD